MRLNELTAEMLQQTIHGKESEQAIAEAARVWAVELESALDGVAERHGVVLLPAEVVLAGAPDYTGPVREAMAAWERALAGPGAVADEHSAGQTEDRP